MKNLKKVLAVMTAVSALAATTSAFAANEATVAGTNIAGSYVNVAAEGETPVYKLDVALNGVTADETKDKTLLVLTEGAGETVEDSEILYIDQGTEAFAGLGLKDEIIDTVTTDGHIVKIGYYDADGNFAIAEGTIAVTEVAEQPQNKVVSVVWGDTTGDMKVDGLDSVAILKSTVGVVENYSITDNDGEAMNVSVGNPLYEDGFVWGNVNNDAAVDGLDSVAILKATVGIAETYTFNGANVSVDASETPATVDIVIPVSAN